MDEDNTGQVQVFTQEQDSGPGPMDLLQSRLTIMEADMLDVVTLLCSQIVQEAEARNMAGLTARADRLARVQARLELVRELRQWITP